MSLVQGCLLSFPSIIAYAEAPRGTPGFWGWLDPGGSTQGYAHRRSGLNRLGKRAESEKWGTGFPLVATLLPVLSYMR